MCERIRRPGRSAAFTRRTDRCVEAAFTGFDTTEAKFGRSTLPVEIERIRRPAAAYERREGQIIEASIKSALQAAMHRYRYIGPVTVPIWKTSRELCAANAEQDISRWTVPADGLPDDSIQLDAVVVTADERTVLAIEVKRSTNAISKGLELDLRAGCLTLRHHLARRGLYVAEVRPLLICWLSDQANRSLVSRETIDSVLGISVRATVEAALTRFRTAFAARYHALILETAQTIAAPVDPTVQPAETTAGRADLVALFDAFARPVRKR